MKKRFNFLTWLDDNRDIGMFLLRVYVGLLLLIKGIQFVTEGQDATEYMGMGTTQFFDFFSVHVVALIHIAGGVLLVMGLLTRVAAIFQTPLLAGAIFFVNGHEKILSSQPQNFDFVMLLLCSLLAITLYGGGYLSVDYLLKKRINKR